MAVDVGGVDHIFLGSGADNVMVDLDDILSANGSVTIHNIDSNSDTLEVGEGSLLRQLSKDMQMLEISLLRKSASMPTVDKSRLSWTMSQLSTIPTTI